MRACSRYLDRIAHQPVHAAVDIFGNRHITPARRPGAPQPAAGEAAREVGTMHSARLSIKLPTGGWTRDWGTVVFDLDFLQLRTQLLFISLVYYSTQVFALSLSRSLALSVSVCLPLSVCLSAPLSLSLRACNTHMHTISCGGQSTLWCLVGGWQDLKSCLNTQSTRH